MLIFPSVLDNKTKDWVQPICKGFQRFFLAWGRWSISWSVSKSSWTAWRNAWTGSVHPDPTSRFPRRSSCSRRGQQQPPCSSGEGEDDDDVQGGWRWRSSDASKSSSPLSSFISRTSSSLQPRTVQPSLAGCHGQNLNSLVTIPTNLIVIITSSVTQVTNRGQISKILSLRGSSLCSLSSQWVSIPTLQPQWWGSREVTFSSQFSSSSTNLASSIPSSL